MVFIPTRTLETVERVGKDRSVNTVVVDIVTSICVGVSQIRRFQEPYIYSSKESMMGMTWANKKEMVNVEVFDDGVIEVLHKNMENNKKRISMTRVSEDSIKFVQNWMLERIAENIENFSS